MAVTLSILGLSWWNRNWNVRNSYSYVAATTKIRSHFQFLRSPDTAFGGLIGWLFNWKCKISYRIIGNMANYLRYNWFWDGDGNDKVTLRLWKFSDFCSRHTVGVAGDDIMFHFLVCNGFEIWQSSTFTQVLSCCLTAPIHHLNQPDQEKRHFSEIWLKTQTFSVIHLPPMPYICVAELNHHWSGNSLPPVRCHPSF